MSDHVVMAEHRTQAPPRPQRPAGAAAQRSPRIGRWIIAVVLVTLAAGIWWGVRAWLAPATLPVAGQFHVVRPTDLEIKITKDGELQAVNNTDIACQVEGQTTIQYLVKEGSTVEKNDVLVTLDSSAIKLKIEDVTLDLQKAEADLTTAREMKDIQESQNATNLEAAQVALLLAKLDYQQYTSGKYPQDLENARTSLKMAQITLKNKEEDLSQTRDLFAKGFVTMSDVKKGELDVTVAQNEVDKARTALMVLEKYTHEKDDASYKNAVAQAEQKLVRVQRENAAQMAQKVSDVSAREQTAGLLKRRLARYKEQEANCTIRAPEAGLVVYASSGERNAAVQIQEGATVRERQLLLRLPDVRTMKAVIRVQESQVSKLTVDRGLKATVRIVGHGRPVGATLTKVSVLPDSGQRWWNPDLKEYPVDLTLDDTPRGMKPGRGVQVEILVDRLEQILAVPIAGLYSLGRDSYVFVRSSADGQVAHRKVGVGASNETHAQITSGLTEGEEILLLQPGQGRLLLEKAGIKLDPTTRPAGRRQRGGRTRPEANQVESASPTPAGESTPPGNGPPRPAAPPNGTPTVPPK